MSALRLALFIPISASRSWNAHARRHIQNVAGVAGSVSKTTPELAVTLDQGTS